MTHLKNFRLDLVFSGHVHAYERSKPVKNVQHFVVGHAGNNEAGPTLRRYKRIDLGYGCFQK